MPKLVGGLAEAVFMPFVVGKQITIKVVGDTGCEFFNHFRGNNLLNADVQNLLKDAGNCKLVAKATGNLTECEQSFTVSHMEVIDPGVPIRQVD